MKVHAASRWGLALGLALVVAVSPGVGRAQEPGDQPKGDQAQGGTRLRDAAKQLWRKLPEPVKAKARKKLLEIIEKSFGGYRPPPAPPALPQTKKEKQAAERARRAALRKLKRAEQKRLAEEKKARRAAQKAAAKGQPVPPRTTPPPFKEVAVPLHRRGSSYYVTAQLNGQHQASFLYDTGASLTTVDRATLARLGQGVPENAPTIRTHTANGVVEQPLVVLESIDLGGAFVAGGFTVSLCEPCSDGRKIGLLGLNFSRRYLVTLDEGAKKLRLVPRVELQDHRFDIEPFLKYEGVGGYVKGTRFYVKGQVRNRAPRAVRDVRVAAVLVDAKDQEVGRVRGTVGSIPSGSAVNLKFDGKAKKFKKFYLELEGADW